ncbi:MAG: NUDIX hydrolase [Candidatus Taylorbacteria bacterium]|nr:NUDIX hydrolase [Candidatus Taylorbacteria bacterium]
MGNVNQKALIKKGGKFLFIQYPVNGDVKHPNKKAWGKWDMPGGRLNEGEDVIEGLKREVREEIGAEIEVKKALVTGTFTNLSGVRIFFVIYEASLVDLDTVFKFEDEEVGEARWLQLSEIVELPILYPEYKEALKSVLV